MICPQCGQALPEGGSFCAGCLTLVNPPPVLLPIVNFCIILVQDLAHGHGDDDTFRQELKKLRTHLDNYRRRLPELDLEAVPLDIIRQVRDLLSAGYAAFEESFNQMEIYLEGREKAHLVRALEVMLKGSRNFYEVDLVAEIAQETVPAPVPCVKCGHMNPAGSRYCESCNASILPAPEAARASTVTYKEGEAPAQAEWHSSHYLRLKQVAEGHLAGTIDNEEFQSTLAMMRNIIEASDTQYKSITLPEETRREPATIEACRLIEEGIAQYREALDTLDSYQENQDEEIIHSGLRRAQEASDKLIRVVLMAREQHPPTDTAPPPPQDPGERSEIDAELLTSAAGESSDSPVAG